jgi:FkbM family methyltransferase
MSVSCSTASQDPGSRKSSLINRDGWFVPAVDRHAFDAIIREVKDINHILPYLYEYRTAIQAGGCFGVWAKELSRYFEKVVCFEPDADNYEAMVMNVGDIENITLIRAALGDRNGSGSIDKIDPANIGAHKVKAGAEFDVLAIDFLGIDNVDLIQLDIEGCEYMAIMGAIATIQESSPVICLEMKGLGEAFGYTDADTVDLMRSLGYLEVKRFHRDVLFKRINAK